ncbi:MAG TPA: SET domain-containing protein [Acetobacteraceae bacterium]|nr:SET domain-containing protein [Acetobacteraceae bacterium]
MTDVMIGSSEGRGRGVFAARHFEPGETIEVCPVIPLSEADARRLDATALYDYYFGWGKDGKAAAIALGYGSLYNHAPSPNAMHNKHEADGMISIIAVRPIERGEEIFIRYNTGIGNDTQKMWFAVR